MSKSNSTLLCIVAVLIFILATATIILINPLERRIIVRNSYLIPGTQLFTDWLSPPVSLKLQFYLFNLTNHQAWINGSAKPNLSQIGPYTYEERRFTVNATYQSNNSSVRYQERRTFHFLASQSAGLESDMLTTVNLVFLKIALKVDNWNSVVEKFVERMLSREHEYLILQRNVSQLIWGYDDPLLAVIEPDKQVVGYYAGKNNTLGLPVEIHSGPSQLGKILTYNNQPTVSCWSSKLANQINGSDGSLFPPGVGSQLYVFTSDLCRSIELEATGTIGMEQEAGHQPALLTYSPVASTFDSPMTNRNNAGFCPFNNTEKCFSDGVLVLSSCIDGGPPLVASMPHLMHADPAYTNAVDGLLPASTEFNTSFHIEPQTGIVVRVSKKLQFNAIVKHNQFAVLTNISDLILPLFFVNESAHLDEKMVEELYHFVTALPMTVTALGSIFLVISSLLLLSLVAQRFFLVDSYLELAAVRRRQREGSESTPLFA